MRLMHHDYEDKTPIITKINRFRDNGFKKNEKESEKNFEKSLLSEYPDNTDYSDTRPDFKVSSFEADTGLIPGPVHRYSSGESDFHLIPTENHRLNYFSNGNNQNKNKPLINSTLTDTKIKEPLKADFKRNTIPDLSIQKSCCNAIKAAGSRLLRGLPEISSLEAAWRGPKSVQIERILKKSFIRAIPKIEKNLETDVSIEKISISSFAPRIAGFSVSLSFDSGKGSVKAILCPMTCAGLLQALTRADIPPSTACPDPVTSAVLGHGILTVLSAVSESGILNPKLISEDRFIPAKIDTCIELAIKINGCTGFMQLVPDRKAAEILTDYITRLFDGRETGSIEDSGKLPGSGNNNEEAEQNDRWNDLPVPAHICMGPVSLSGSTILNLSPGDVLCPDPQAQIVDGLPAGSAFIRSSGLRNNSRVAIGTIDARSLVINDIAPVQTTAKETRMPSPKLSPESLSIDVHVVIDTISMTLRELSSIGAGSVFSISELPPRAKLMAGEQFIATGELVDIEGVLGVRILEGTSQ